MYYILHKSYSAIRFHSKIQAFFHPYDKSLIIVIRRANDTSQERTIIRYVDLTRISPFGLCGCARVKQGLTRSPGGNVG